jgi:hypothetical protein
MDSETYLSEAEKEENINQASKLKSEGNNWVKAKQYADALEVYKQAINTLK